MIDGQNFSDQLVKSDLRTYDNIQKDSTGQKDDYASGCLLDYPYFKKHYRVIAINLNKQKAIDVNTQRHTNTDAENVLHRCSHKDRFL